jgi:hypothetical protein
LLAVVVVAAVVGQKKVAGSELLRSPVRIDFAGYIEGCRKAETDAGAVVEDSSTDMPAGAGSMKKRRFQPFDH